LTTARQTLARLALAAAAALPALAACTDWAGYDIDMAAGKVPQLATMRRSVIPDPYQMVRLPPEGTVPVAGPNGDVPPPFTSAQLDSVAPTLRPPFALGDPAVLARGQVAYHNNCFVCHGVAGDGKGPVSAPGKVVGVAAINGAATAGRSDGYIYGVIAAGRGLMPPYGPRLTHQDRWAIVAYVRQLQRQAGAAPAPGATTGVPPAALGQGVPAPGPTAAGQANLQGPGAGTQTGGTTGTTTDTAGRNPR
jgi:mono/diheme cytochrome c family protein